MKRIIMMFMLLTFLVALMSKIQDPISIQSMNCVGCGDCERVCPTDAISIVEGKAVIDQEECIQCEVCIKACNYDAIRKSE